MKNFILEHCIFKFSWPGTAATCQELSKLAATCSSAALFGGCFQSSFNAGGGRGHGGDNGLMFPIRFQLEVRAPSRQITEG